MYKIYALPYSYDALEPFIDTHTVGLHYQKHQKNYLKKLNELLLKENYQYQYPMELLSYHMEEFFPNKREDILFNLGGVLNHIIYFHSISDKKVEPEGILKKKILQSFDSLDNWC